MEKKFKRLLVTSALPYANGPIHLGHLAGAYLPADIYVRYQRLQKRDVLFISGSDEHGVPITITAEKEKITPQAVVDRFHTMNKEAFQKFGMSFDNYSRTSSALHHETAKEFFLDLLGKGYLIDKEEEQFYDEQAAMFLPDRYVEGICPNCGSEHARGDQCDSCGAYYNQLQLKNPVSLVSGKTPVVRTTKHWYLRLGAFQKQLEAYIEGKSPEWKENVLQQSRSWLKEGLQDRAVTRDLNWGVPVPLEGVNGKVLYVWFDAVLGYISATKEWAAAQHTPERWKEYWQDDTTRYVAFIGKDNIVFHTIVFPAILMGTGGYILPDNVPANEFLNLEGGKFSKSRHHAIDVKDMLATFPADLVRYSMATNLPETKDSDFYWKDFQAKVNNELADILGNFINRTLAFTGKNFNGTIPARGPLNERDTELIAYIASAPDRVGSLLERFKFRDAVAEMMNVARAANKYFNDSEPWKTAKNDPAACATTINICIQTVRSLALLFSPVLPFASEKIWAMLNLSAPLLSEGWNSAGELRIPDGHVLGTPSILFTKIEDETINEELAKLGIPAEGATAKAPEKTPMTPIKPVITYDDFAKVDLRVGKIVACEAVPKSKKLLKLQIELGDERRQVVAGIAGERKPEDIVGSSVIIVANLAPATLMGVESQGMILATHGNGKEFALLTVTNEVPSGSGIK
jgi:methionyl-tRNA synthetase